MVERIVKMWPKNKLRKQSKIYSEIDKEILHKAPKTISESWQKHPGKPKILLKRLHKMNYKKIEKCNSRRFQ